MFQLIATQKVQYYGRQVIVLFWDEQLHCSHLTRNRMVLEF